jgi:hypothetical protein
VVSLFAMAIVIPSTSRLSECGASSDAWRPSLQEAVYGRIGNAAVLKCTSAALVQT